MLLARRPNSLFTRRGWTMFWNQYGHMALLGAAVAGSSGGTAVKLNEHPWSITIVDHERKLVEVSRGNDPLKIFHYGESSAGEMYFCSPGTTSCTPVRGFNPEIGGPQLFANLPL